MKMKKILSLLLVICMAMVACVPSAYAAGGSNTALKTVQYTGRGEIGTAIPSMIDKGDRIAPQIIVAEGSNAFLTKITIYPGYLDGSNVRYDDTLGVSASFNNNYPGGSLHVSATQAKNVLASFLSNNGRPAELWRMEVKYNIVNDKWGSYGKYFEYYPDGNLVYPNKQSNGTIRYNLVPYPVTEATVVAGFKIPENTSAYYFDIAGGYWYYNNYTHQTRSHDVNAKVFVGYPS